MKRALKSISKPVKQDLFTEVGYTQEELTLMKYLYIDRINQNWVSDTMGISIPTLINWHNQCIEQLINFYNYEKYKLDNGENSCYNKYFCGLNLC